MSIYKKLLDVQKEVLGLSKDKKSFNYDYVTGNKLLGVVKPLMNKYGLLLKQEPLEVKHEVMDYTNDKGKAKKEVLYHINFKFTWIDVETGETDVSLFSASGMNGFEKGVGSALTYAERYFLLKYFHIATDEDDIDNPERKELEMIEIKQKAIKMCRKYNTDKTDKELMGMDLESLKAYYNELKAAAEKGAQK